MGRARTELQSRKPRPTIDRTTVEKALDQAGVAKLVRSVEYAKRRAPFGKPLATNQGIQFPLVELRTQCEMLKVLVQKTAWAMDKYGPFTQSDKVSMCNYWANRLCCEAADRSNPPARSAATRWVARTI